MQVTDEMVRVARETFDNVSGSPLELATNDAWREALEAALAVDGLALQGWQDISTAPKDGSFILAYNASHDEQMVVGWTQDAGLPEIFPTGCWTDAGSRNCAINYTVNANYFQLWQPLPQPPAASDREERR